MMPLRAVSQAVIRRSVAPRAQQRLQLQGLVASSQHSLLLRPHPQQLQVALASTVPRFGTEAEMQAEAIEQIRARVKYQKELIKAKGHGTEEDVMEMWRWVNITFWVALPVCVLSGLYSLFFDEHAHRVDGELPEYMHVRSKEFPWECSDCDFFDMACWKKCRAEKA